MIDAGYSTTCMRTGNKNLVAVLCMSTAYVCLIEICSTLVLSRHANVHANSHFNVHSKGTKAPPNGGGIGSIITQCPAPFSY